MSSSSWKEECHYFLTSGLEKHTRTPFAWLVIKAALILSTAEREHVYHEFMNPPLVFYFGL
jgi:hypothetical protein